MCNNRKLKVNATKIKILMFERNSNTDCTVWLDGKEIESVMSKDGGIDNRMKERTQRGKRVVETLRTVI